MKSKSKPISGDWNTFNFGCDKEVLEYDFIFPSSQSTWHKVAVHLLEAQGQLTSVAGVCRLSLNALTWEWNCPSTGHLKKKTGFRGLLSFLKKRLSVEPRRRWFLPAGDMFNFLKQGCFLFLPVLLCSLMFLTLTEWGRVWGTAVTFITQLYCLFLKAVCFQSSNGLWSLDWKQSQCRCTQRLGEGCMGNLHYDTL